MNRLAVTLISITFAAGCVHHDPKKDSESYREILDTGTRDIQFTSGQPLSVNDAMALANRANESLSIEGEAYVRAILDKRRSVAAMLPSVDLNPGYSLRERSTGGGYDADLDIPIDLSFVVFDGNQNINSYWRDVYLIERQRNQLLEAQESLLFDVADVYYSVLRAEAQVRVLEGSLQVQGERLRDTQGREKAGTARPLDVSQTAAQYAATRVQLIEAKRLVGDGRATLAYLTDRPVQQSPLSDQFTPGAAIAPINVLIETASRYRSELAAAERSIAAAQRDVRVAVGQYYPQVTIDFSAFLYRESVPDARTWESLLAVSFPIFSGGRIDADVRTAWSFLREAQLVETQTRRRITQELDQSIRNLTASADRIAELQVQLKAATDAFTQADASYKAGLGTNLERVTAQDAKLQAELALATETIDQKVLWLSLLRSCGTLRETMLDVREDETAAPTTQTAKVSG